MTEMLMQSLLKSKRISSRRMEIISEIEPDVYRVQNHLNEIIEGNYGERILQFRESEITTELITTIEECDIPDLSPGKQNKKRRMGCSTTGITAQLLLLRADVQIWSMNNLRNGKYCICPDR